VDYDLGIIGAGNIAEAIVRGLSRRGHIPIDRIIVADVVPERRQVFEVQLQVKAVEDISVVAKAKILLLSVKPQQMSSVLAGLRSVLDPRTLILSVAAAIKTDFISTTLGPDIPWRVVRAMPNTPLRMGEGATAICPGAHATDADLIEAQKIFEAAGVVMHTTEDHMDAITAVSGSGPAYIFYLVEQMIRAAADMGISPDDAHLMATRTALGAARMLVESNVSPATLRRQVTSPGGTTQAALNALDAGKWPAITIDAIKAAAARSKELSK
jgi:pyrroline-5-carboxylate reductase